MFARASASSGGGGNLNHLKIDVQTPSRNTVTSIKADNLAVIYAKTNTSSASYQAYTMAFFEDGQPVSDESYFQRNMSIRVNDSGYIVIDNAYAGYANVNVAYGYWS